jgi:RES domain-containing protein
MIHESDLLDKLDGFPKETYSGQVFRATRKSLDPLVTSRSGGRWMPSGAAAVLYTSLQPEGALAEISFHWSQWNPRPSKTAALHTLEVVTDRTLKLVRTDLHALGVSDASYQKVNLIRTQQIGAAIEFLGCDGLIAPSARWACDNLILFADTANFGANLQVVSAEEVDWIQWAEEKGLLQNNEFD